MNARADGAVALKLYVQARDAVALADPYGVAARQLAAVARAEGADAGGVLSFDVEKTVPRPRAFFVALRDSAAAARARSTLGSVRPAMPREPICRKSRRETPAQLRERPVFQILSMVAPPVGLSP